MRNIRKMTMNALMLSMALLLSVIPYIHASASRYDPAMAERSRASAIPMPAQAPIARNLIDIDSQPPFVFQPIKQLHTVAVPAPAQAFPTGSVPLPATAPTPVPFPQLANSGSASAANPSKAIMKSAPAAPYEQYVTTAYYLNVREKASSESQILRVVEKGDVLKVTGETDNGWLALHDGGFVHGAYAETVVEAPTAAGTKTLAPLAVIAAEDGAAAAEDGAAAAGVEAPVTALAAGAADTVDVPVEEPKPSKPTSTVQSDSGLTEAHIVEILEGTALEDPSLAAAILEIEDEYGINAYFTIAVMKLESGNGKSKLARTKNNLFGLNATGGSNSKAYAFDTKADSVRKFGQLIAESYVDKGYTTIEKVAKKYCPPNSKWSGLVKKIMFSDHDKLADSRLL